MSEVIFTRESTYTELKNWFVERLKKYQEGDQSILPLTLDNKYIYYSNVPQTAMIYINLIDMELEKHKDQIKTSTAARAAKGNLFNLWKALQDHDKWNAPRPTIESLRNDYNCRYEDREEM